MTFTFHLTTAKLIVVMILRMLRRIAFAAMYYASPILYRISIKIINFIFLVGAFCTLTFGIRGSINKAGAVLERGEGYVSVKIY